MAIYVVTGKPRHGKTYFLVSRAVEWIKSGERVFSNISLKLEAPIFKKYLIKNKLNTRNTTNKNSIYGDLDDPNDLANPRKQVFFWRNLRDWNKMDKGIILCDEGTRYFNPRRWQMLSEETETKLQQHGKEMLDIWLTVQHWSRLDSSLRVLCESFFVVRKHNFLNILTYVKWSEHYLEDLERVDRLNEEDRESFRADWGWFMLSKKYAECFDTKQMVGKSEPMGLWHEERVCKTCGKAVVSHS